MNKMKTVIKVSYYQNTLLINSMYLYAFGTNTLQTCSDNKNTYMYTLQIGRPYGSSVITNWGWEL
jgi:hypothetical protein